jgi:dTDP-4-amino-4,6-dideoxygalactose transaminase
VSVPTLPTIELGAPILGEAEKQALLAVIDDRWLTMGDRVRAFERAFADLHEVDDAVAVGSATAALQLILAAFDVGAGDEVLVPSMSFVATASVVVHAGATPVFVDVESGDRPHMSLDDARRRITSRTRAITVMHYGGFALDLPAWRRLADEHGLLLFEDAAHVAGLTGATGTVSDAAAFSFFTNKNMTTAEGGMVVVADEGRRRRVRLLRAHGMTASTLDRDRGRAVGYDVVECGFNFRMDELRGALGLVQIERLPGWNRTRVELMARYRTRLAEDVPAIEVPFDVEHPTSGHIMPVLLPDACDRALVMASMRAAGIQTSVHYPPIHRFSYYRGRFGEVALPNTEHFSRRELTLPLHPALNADDVDRVVAALGGALRTPTGPADCREDD